MKKNLIYYLTIISTWLGGYSQNIKSDITFSTPDIAALSNEVLTPVSLTNGTVNIEIPIYTFKDHDITVPISLKYDASGIKVDAHPGVVGQNWRLNAGGAITRIVKGMPDETLFTEQCFPSIDPGVPITTTTDAGYMLEDNLSILRSANWHTEENILNIVKSDKVRDLEPDEFVFNFCGHTGKFYMDNNGKYQVQGAKGYKIDVLLMNNMYTFEPNNTTPLAQFNYLKKNFLSVPSVGDISAYYRLLERKIVGFKLTDPAGICYYFGFAERYEQCQILGVPFSIKDRDWRTIERTSNFFSQFYVEKINSWKLTRIASQQADVSLDYDYMAPVAVFGKNYNMLKIDNSSPASFPLTGNLLGNNGATSSYYHGGTVLSGTIIQSSRLEAIYSTVGVIDFNYSSAQDLKYDYNTIISYLDRLKSNSFDPNIVTCYPGWYPMLYLYGVLNHDFLNGWLKLDEIAVFGQEQTPEGEDVFIKKYRFAYRENAQERLQLQYLREYSGRGTEALPPYVFTYNNSVKLPPYMSYQQDHWGYFNGKNATVDCNSTQSMMNHYNQRESDFQYTQAEILTKITYPTGGTKEFVYEPHVYNRILKRNSSTGEVFLDPIAETSGGGLRIQQITEKDGNTERKKQYEYEPGVLNGEIQYYWPTITLESQDGSLVTNIECFFSYSILPTSINPAGGNVSYTHVTETEEGRGKTEYIFRGHDDSNDEKSLACIGRVTPYSPLTDKSSERGQVKTIKLYEENASTPIETQAYTYVNPTEAINAIHINSYPIRISNRENITLIDASSYKVYLHSLLPETETTTYHRNNREYVQQQCFTYNNEQFVKSVRQLQSDGSWLETEYHYVSDVVPASVESVPAQQPNAWDTESIQMLRDRNSLKTVLMETQRIEKGGVSQIVASNIYSYRKKESSKRIYLDKYYTLNLKETTNHNESYLWDNGCYQEGASFRHDLVGNIKEALIDSVYTSYVWGYQHIYPIIEIQNATWEQVESILGEKTLNNIAYMVYPTIEQIMAWGQQLKNGLPNASVYIYTYKPMVGMTSQTDPQGRTTYYDYDDFGRLIEIYRMSGGHKEQLQTYEYRYAEELKPTNQ